MNDVATFIGKEKIMLLHVNDAKGTLGSGLDRHDHIGQGNIGIKGLRNFLNHPDFCSIPIIIETPKKTDKDDINNLKSVRYLINE